MKKYILGIFFIAQSAFATSGAVSQATGGAGVGNVEMDDGVYLNPASIALFPARAFAVSSSKDALNIHFSDNGKEALFPAALAYTKDENANYKNSGYHLALAYGFDLTQATKSEVNSPWAIGADLQQREIKDKALGKKYSQFIYSLGALYQVTSGLTLGYALKNQAQSDTVLPDSVDQDGSWSVGAAYVYDGFSKLKFDLEQPDRQSQFIYKYGIESYLNDWIIFRLGYQANRAIKADFLTAGLGFSGPQFSLSYAYQAEVKNKRKAVHTIDLNLPF